MPNIPITVIASPGTHKDLVKKINSWKYTVNGRHFSGKQAPFISEIRQYDLRVPEEIEGYILRDLGVQDMFAARFGTTTTWHMRVVQFILRQLRRLTPFKPIVMAPGQQEYSLGTWAYVFSPGPLKRKPDKLKIKDREIL